jgi:cytochrome c-type biogenesis protein
MNGIGELVVSGPFLVAAALAFLAGVVSFLSPCVVPLVPGYLAYVTGLSGSLSELQKSKRRKLMVAGTTLFVLGFSAVFVFYGALFGEIGSWLVRSAPVIERVLGVLVIVLGVGYLGGFSWLMREARMKVNPVRGLWGAPIVGVVFAVGWTPCIGPTLAAVQAMAFSQSDAGRGALLSLIYSLGLGLPFIAIALGFQWVVNVLPVLRRHQVLITRIGGALLITIGVLLVTGLWSEVTFGLRSWISGFETII